MKALKVTKGDTTWLISLKNAGVLNAVINCAEVPEQDRDNVELILGGLDSTAGTHFSWHPVELHLGDRVIVDVIEYCEGDEPDELQAPDPQQDEQRRRQYVRQQAAELGWSIHEPDEG